VEQERAAQVHRRLDALVEDADLRAVADSDDVALHRDLVARAQLQDLALVGDRERDLVRRHHASPFRPWNSLWLSGFGSGTRHASRSNSTLPCASTCAVARRAAQHW
jgi:hypothetical protein